MIHQSRTLAHPQVPLATCRWTDRRSRHHRRRATTTPATRRSTTPRRATRSRRPSATVTMDRAATTAVSRPFGSIANDADWLRDLGFKDDQLCVFYDVREQRTHFKLNNNVNIPVFVVVIDTLPQRTPSTVSEQDISSGIPISIWICCAFTHTATVTTIVFSYIFVVQRSTSIVRCIKHHHHHHHQTTNITTATITTKNPPTNPKTIFILPASSSFSAHTHRLPLLCVTVRVLRFVPHIILYRLVWRVCRVHIYSLTWCVMLLSMLF